MSQELINLNADLKRLRDEGYEISIVNNHLLMRHVPYVTQDKQIEFGVLVSELTLAGDNTVRPATHVIYFAGSIPCDKHGMPLNKIINGTNVSSVIGDVAAQFSFSSKPQCGYYSDYYEKLSTYAKILAYQARAIRPNVTAKTFRITASNDNDAVFKYLDTATSRADITEISNKLKQDRIAIIGLGGTGSYVLDFLAKMPVKEIHLYDDKVLLSHNAFRSPGCSSIAQLRKQPKKVAHYKRVYSHLHNGIIAHPKKVTSRNAYKFKGFDFVFLCIDDNVSRFQIVKKLNQYGIPFIDVGMGLEKCNDSIMGQVRTTFCQPLCKGHADKRIPMSEGAAGDDLYNSNIQCVELNAKNAAEAVIRWKKFCGFYLDLEQEHHSVYSIDGNHTLNEEKAS